MEKLDQEQLVARQDAAALSRQVYEHMLRQIVELQIRPGERINITKIADQLGVSRTPLRSAMDRLVADGLVERVGDRGYQAASIGITDCLDLCDARKILEGTAAYMATNNISSADLEVLERSIENAKICLARQGYDDFAAQDSIFHETLLRAADNRYLLLVYNSVKVRINRYRYIISAYCRESAEKDTNHAIAKHTCILQALKNRYSSVARNEMEEHIAYTYRTLFGLGRFISDHRSENS